MGASSVTLLAIDQGTTGSKALLVNERLEPLASCTLGFKQYYPKPGWVEHDLREIWDTVIKSIGEVVKKAKPKSIAAIGITNQRETLCFWDRSTGEPLAPAIVWQDRRTADHCDHLKQKGMESFFQERTGLVLDPYFTGTKVSWALKNWDVLRTAHRAGRLAAGTIDSYLIARLAGGGTHFTEPSNASRTLCYHLTRHQWDPELCAALDVPLDIWPEVRPSFGRFAQSRGVPGLPDGIPITGNLGDQQAALLGQACIQEGTAKCTYGTGAFMLLNTGKRPVKSRHRLLSTIAWAATESDFTYALEGSAFMAGAAVQWLRDGLGIIKDSSEVEALAASVPSSEGVTFVPAMTGLGSPHWDPHATGLITGITRGTTRAHIARATLEGIAFQNADILTAMQSDLGKSLTALHVDGGACTNNLLMQFQSDILATELIRPVMQETTSLGAVFAAGLGAGIWSSLSDVRKTWREERRFKPLLPESDRKAALARWKLAVTRVMMQSKA